MRLFSLAAALVSALAAAESSRVNGALEVGAAHFVAQPQAGWFGWGEALSLQLDVKVAGPLAALVSGSFANLEPKAAFLTGPGRVFTLGLGPRLRLFDDRKGESFLSHVWLDGQLLLAGTGPYVRFAYALGAGVVFSLSDLFGFGPYLRFVHVVEPGGAGVDGSDALLLHGGLCFTVHLPPGSAADERDGDGDGVADLNDACPRDPADTPDGCPRPEPVKPLSTPPPPPEPKFDPAPEPKPEPPPVVPELPAATTVHIKLLDRDGDGIGDSRDACPNEPETLNGADDDDGCPDPRLGPALVVRVKEELQLTQPLKQRNGRLEPASKAALALLGKQLGARRARVEVALPDAALAEVRAALLEAGASREAVEVVSVLGRAGSVRALLLPQDE